MVALGALATLTGALACGRSDLDDFEYGAIDNDSGAPGRDVEVVAHDGSVGHSDGGDARGPGDASAPLDANGPRDGGVEDGRAGDALPPRDGSAPDDARVPRDGASDGEGPFDGRGPTDARGGADGEGPVDGGGPVDGEGARDSSVGPFDAEGPPDGADGASDGEAAACPEPYAGCTVQASPSPMHQDVCTADELRRAATACAGGARSADCDAFFGAEATSDPACARCLSPFDFPFLELKGLIACLEPFASESCRASTACIGDCVATSCGGCATAAERLQCDEEVAVGACAAYFADVDVACLTDALSSGGAFCNPALYGGYGGWLRAVGAEFCGP